MTSNRSCLITGAAGFIGTALARRFKEADFRVHGLDLVQPSETECWDDFSCGALEYANLAKLTAGRPPSVICHLAGSSSVPASMRDPLHDFMASLPGTANLLAWNGGQGPRARLLYYSSAAVYGEPQCLPLCEGSPVAPISPYGIHKAAAELMVSEYAKIYGFEALCLRPFSVYGPGLKRQVVWDVARKARDASSAGLAGISLLGTGHETRDFVYIEDLTRATVELATVPLRKLVQSINLASGVETEIRTLAFEIVRALGQHEGISFSSQRRAGDPDRWCADISLLRSLISFEPTPLEIGLQQFAQWFKTQEES